MKYKPGDYIETAGLTDRQISEWLVALRDSGAKVVSIDPDYWYYRDALSRRISPVIGWHVDADAVLGYRVDYSINFTRRIEWPPAPTKEPKDNRMEVAVNLFILVCMILVMVSAWPW